METRTLSRLGGALYLIIIILGMSEEVVVRARVTAANLRSMESLWRLGIVAELILLVCAIVLTMIFYVLFRPVSERLAILAVLFNLVSIAIEGVAALSLIAALHTDPALPMRLHSQGFGIALLFFGCECLVLGWLIFQSGFFPRVIGVLMALAGASYITNTLTLILAPALARQLFPGILVPAFVGEVSLCLWMLLKGVSERVPEMA